MTTYHDTNERLGPFAMLFLTLLFLFAKCSDCKGQVHFQFNSSTVVMVDTTGRMDVGSASWPVIASGDSLLIGCPSLPLMWHGVKWERMDSGDLYFFSPVLIARYSTGPGGQALYIRPMGAIREMELYERNTTKL